MVCMGAQKKCPLVSISFIGHLPDLSVTYNPWSCNSGVIPGRFQASVPGQHTGKTGMGDRKKSTSYYINIIHVFGTPVIDLFNQLVGKAHDIVCLGKLYYPMMIFGYAKEFP